MVAVAIHDTVYLVDFSVRTIQINDIHQEGEEPIADYVISQLKAYEKSNLSKFVGAGLPVELMKKSPTLCSRLWLELDIVPISILPESEGHETELKDRTFWSAKCVDEQADSMARKCIM